MNKTSIEWAQNPDGTPGFTWNPITGCLNSCRDTYCYASKLAKGRLRSRYLANSILPCHDEPDHELHHADPFYPRFWPGKLDELLGSRPSGVFVCNMGELFAPWVPEEWTRAVLNKLTDPTYDQHRFYLLTNQPQELVKWSPFPPNCWVGVSATHDGDIGHAEAALSRVQASVKYISVEPLLEHMIGISPLVLKESGIDWLIIGAQSRPTVMPKIEWLKEIVEAADRAGAKVFLKDSLWPLLKPVFEAAGCIDNYFDDTGLLRQEMPEGVPCAV